MAANESTKFNKDSSEVKKLEVLRDEMGEPAFAEVVQKVKDRALARKGQNTSRGDVQGQASSEIVASNIDSPVSMESQRDVSLEGLDAEVLTEVLQEISGQTSRVDHVKPETAEGMVDRITGL